MIKDASPGDTVTVKGRCLGSYSIKKDLVLLGRPTRLHPVPVLDARGLWEDTVSIWGAEVELSNLKVSGGQGNWGGIYNNGGTVTLTDVIVQRNRVGGISNLGTMILAGKTLVRWNRGVYKGGIYNTGQLTLNDFSKVVENRSDRGGGIFNTLQGIVTLNDSSVVASNTVKRGGGGIYNWGGVVVLNDSASVRYNFADGNGGGVLNGLDGSYVGNLTLNGDALIHSNRADYNQDGIGTGGGIWNCGDLTGAVEEINVTNNGVGQGSGSESVSNVFEACP